MQYREILPERILSVPPIVAVLQTGEYVNQNGERVPVTSDRDFIKYIRSQHRASLLDKGLHSVVFVARGGAKECVLKSTERPEHDRFYNFARVSQENTSNPLFPKILYSGIAPWGWGYAIIEHLKIGKFGQFDRAATALLQMYADDFQELNAELQQSPSVSVSKFAETMVDTWQAAHDRTIHSGHRAFLAMIGADSDQFEQFVNQVYPLGECDLHEQNMGWRTDGQVVFFDPV